MPRRETSLCTSAIPLTVSDENTRHEMALPGR